MNTPFFTGRGDGGESAYGNRRLRKDDALFALLGDLDELNSWVGFCRAAASGLPTGKGTAVPVAEALRDIQDALFTAQAEVAEAGFGYASREPKRITPAHTQALERTIEAIDIKLPRLANFVLPGGSDLAARLDLARTVARRMERAAVAFSVKQPLSAELLRFLNRLSSALFALARYANLLGGAMEEHPDYR